jgi:hypothetical protein
MSFGERFFASTSISDDPRGETIALRNENPFL